ncbi:hypothetical protein LTR56_009602 [Elasticomyces elasticus]|nr:hypothetical protein LTR56_009602 [Elasticomyces elasticus]KAK3657280.1 hypothetical protein LTR22_009455 [Elasticomyces elasticus]KAK4922172.1 hypothetical protein LTR49_010392 [Elasticomyces elasticus]KAK5760888.1 hypothetical protein LTS12_009065 [Elasticomyces elasticus]
MDDSESEKWPLLSGSDPVARSLIESRKEQQQSTFTALKGPENGRRAYATFNRDDIEQQELRPPPVRSWIRAILSWTSVLRLVFGTTMIIFVANELGKKLRGDTQFVPWWLYGAVAVFMMDTGILVFICDGDCWCTMTDREILQLWAKLNRLSMLTQMLGSLHAGFVLWYDVAVMEGLWSP